MRTVNLTFFKPVKCQKWLEVSNFMYLHFLCDYNFYIKNQLFIFRTWRKMLADKTIYVKCNSFWVTSHVIYTKKYLSLFSLYKAKNEIPMSWQLRVVCTMNRRKKFWTNCFTFNLWWNIYSTHALYILIIDVNK